MDADNRRPSHQAIAPPDQWRTAIAQQAWTTPGGRPLGPPFHGLAAFPLHHNSSEPHPDRSMFPRQERGETTAIRRGKQRRGEGMVGAPEEIRTPDPQIRSLVLYPAELRARLERANLLGRPGKGKNYPRPLRQWRDSPYIPSQIRPSTGGYGGISVQAAFAPLWPWPTLVKTERKVRPPFGARTGLGFGVLFCGTRLAVGRSGFFGRQVRTPGTESIMRGIPA